MDDRAMAEWLRAQPSLSRTRVSREGQVVTFEFTMADPPVGDSTILGKITKECERNGYIGQQGFISAFGRYPAHPASKGRYSTATQ